MARAMTTLHSDHLLVTRRFLQYYFFTELCFYGSGTRGGGCLNTPPPPPSLDPPKVFEPVFLQSEILGEKAGTKGDEFSFGLLRG